LIAKLPYLVALQSSSIFIITVISCHDLSVHIMLLRVTPTGNSSGIKN